MFMLFSLTEELREPDWLVVVLYGDGAGVEKDHGDDEPEPPLLLAHLADGDAGGADGGPELARRA